ncbi:SusC/RagA family TonB-linked outer membrane protein [Ekhidna sp.]|uniref:SusC/RagA family TonB-linked outer membrane protein n=1 Tax=Ekhidna sp. TaxID=2608089 RepID=UPI003B505DB5
MSIISNFQRRTLTGKTFLILLFYCAAFLVTAQSRTVTGTITDASDGTTLPGVTVQIKGTQSGVATDIEGKYTLEVPANSVLVFSYIGYLTVEQTVGNRSVIDVALNTEIQELSEIVVVGYGQVEKGDVTGVVNKISEKDFNTGVLTSPSSLIAGKVAGVQVISNDGAPGSGISIRIRGGTSLTAGNEPLYVVDGVPLENDGVAGVRNPLNFINPADIADITVLKDASSAAIYGSRGANGVVIITTKSGKAGKPQFTYDGSYTVGFNGQGVTMLSAPEFRFTVERKGPRNEDELGSSNTDWFDEVTQLAQGMNHNLGVSFGGKTNTGRVSLNYQNIDGLLKTDNLERVSGNVNLTQNLLNDDLKIGLNTKHSIINNRFAPNVVGSALVFDPTQAVFAEDTATGGYFEWSSPLAPGNPVAQLDQTFNIGKTVRNLIGANLTYDLPFMDGLSVKVNYAYDNSIGKSQVTRLINTKAGVENGSFTTFEDSRTSNLLETYLNYNSELSFGKLDLIAGYSYQDFSRNVDRSLFKRDTVSLDVLNISDPNSFISDGKLNEIRQYLDEPLIFELENRLISFWGRANLSIQDKYLITATLRRDGSTRFGDRNRWGLFPSLAVAWRVIDEPFAEGLENVMSNLKLRMSYGVTGNEEIGDYLYVNLYQPGDDRSTYIFGQDTINTFRPNAVDPDIKWEETRSLNFGIDYGFLDGRIYGSIDLYRKLTTDLLFNIAFPIGTLTGDRAVTNIGEMENKGIELMVNSIVIDKPDMKLDLGFNIAHNKNEILKLDNSNLPDFQGYTTGGISGDVGQSIQILKVGFPANSFFVYEHKKDANGNPIPDGEDVNDDGLRNDLDMYVDQNDDGVINEDDLRPYKNPAPDLIFGLTGNFSYKKFDVALTFRGQIGNYTYNNVFSQYGAYQGVDNTFAPNNIHISAYENDFTERQLLSDIYVENASFLKLDNLTVGYRIDKIKNVNARAYLTATNLMTITGYSGADPEAGIGGIDNNLYPRSRTFIVGLNLTF